jgi:hypothetical protein
LPTRTLWSHNKSPIHPSALSFHHVCGRHVLRASPSRWLARNCQPGRCRPCLLGGWHESRAIALRQIPKLSRWLTSPWRLARRQFQTHPNSRDTTKQSIEHAATLAMDPPELSCDPYCWLARSCQPERCGHTINPPYILQHLAFTMSVAGTCCEPELCGKSRSRRVG